MRERERESDLSWHGKEKGRRIMNNCEAAGAENNCKTSQACTNKAV